MIKIPSKTTVSYAMPTVIFLAFTMAWIFLQAIGGDEIRDARQIWGATYQVMSLYGGIIGIHISTKWGGYRSVLGKAILAFSIGLFLQSFGQTYSSYYVYRYSVETPSYPGIGDIGFFGSVLLYIYGVLLLYKVSGARYSLSDLQHKVWALVVPLILLVSSYGLFLQHYSFDFSDIIKILLDFGYPLGQATYVSIALLILISSRKILGGAMRRPILFLIFALLFQYISDFNFLYQANYGSWYVAGTMDYLYLVSYFLMTIVLIHLGNTFNKLRDA